MNNLLKIILFSVGLIFCIQNINAQSYEISLKQRRMGDKIGVEFWVKATDNNNPKISELTLGVDYNTDFLSPSDTSKYGFISTDSVNYNVDQYSHYEYFTSKFHKSNGYSVLTSNSETDGTDNICYFNVQSVSTSNQDAVDIETEGRGSFLGRIEFDIINHQELTNKDFTNIKFSTKNINGNEFKLIDAAGIDKTSDVSLIDSEEMTIKGITILNPNGPNEIVNRDKDYNSMNTAGYPIYFERSGIFTPGPTNRYGTSPKLAYVFDYVVEYNENIHIDSQEWVEFMRVSEHRSSLGFAFTFEHVASGEITTSNGAGSGYLLTQGDGSQLPVGSDDGYDGVLRVMWDNDPEFPHASEKARLRIRQLDTNGYDDDIILRDIIEDKTFDISDANFTLMRLPLSVENQNIQFNIYPNPTNDIIYIDTENKVNIELFDIFGNKLLEDYNTKLDISKISPGTYYFRYLGISQMVVKI